MTAYERPDLIDLNDWSIGYGACSPTGASFHPGNCSVGSNAGNKCQTGSIPR